MKIAFDNALPEQAQVAALIRESGLEGKWDAGRFFDGQPGGSRVISAYDAGRLVGVGRMLEAGPNEEGTQGRLDIVVLPDYRSRDIVGTIFKLLKTPRPLPARVPETVPIN
ncbi:GNAT family N-acetyltransferase [Paenibacillus sp. GYB003]|uniref:GNAT family N-acetyltransferase n=1 Tax=Paenibacillus sp. GYB003 TaxID=2994392 RepID=UPI002F9646F8